MGGDGERDESRVRLRGVWYVGGGLLGVKYFGSGGLSVCEKACP